MDNLKDGQIFVFGRGSNIWGAAAEISGGSVEKKKRRLRRNLRKKKSKLKREKVYLHLKGGYV